MKKHIALILTLSTLLQLTSCGEYQKVLKSEDVKVKYDAAEAYYEAGDFRRAERLFEQILPKYRGKPQAERITFFYANALYERKSYYLAAYQYETFIKAYPKSQKIEEAMFMAAKSKYMLSPTFSLDQKATLEAMDILQEFINGFPNSERMVEANLLTKELREKLEKKAFEIAKQYNTIRDYKAAIKALDAFVVDYPGTPFREAALYEHFDAAYELAVNSIQSKKMDRLQNAKKIHETLIRYYPESDYLKKTAKKLEVIDEEIRKFAS